MTVGISVCCRGAGAWGKIDDAKLNRVESSKSFDIPDINVEMEE